MPENVWSQHADKLAGAWRCISYHMFDGTGPDKKLIAKPHGDSPLGRVQLSKQGYISAHVANPNTLVPLASGKTWQEADAEEVARVAKGESMYCGRLQLFQDDQGLYWQTKVEIHSDSNRVGGIEERRVEYIEEGGKQYMILQPTRDMVMEDGRRTRGVLKWEKFE